VKDRRRERAELGPALSNGPGARRDTALLEQWCRASRERRAPRTLVIVAHPDDDILGLGARLRFVAGQVDIAYVTDGAPAAALFYHPLGFETREQYARARRAEAQRALHLAGVPEGRAHELGVVDQRALYELGRVVRAVLGLTRGLAPDVLLTHAYEGGHPDHDATACAVHAASSLLGLEGGRAPVVLEFAGYYAGGADLVRGEFSPGSGPSGVRLELDAETQQYKRALLSCHQSQAPVWQAFPLSHELFRVAPRYDFSQPPSDGFYYDRVDWGASGSEFLRRAPPALASLGVEARC
jgi:LmbE family N-acetylglucosaminyl deacetylase